MTPAPIWLTRSKTRVFFDMHLPAWPGKGIAEKFDPEALARAIADSGADSAVLFAKCQYGNFYTSIEGEELHPGLRGVDLLAETADRLRARGVRTIAYYSVSWDEKVADQHPEWLAQNADGERGKGPWRWRTLCINGPYARIVEGHLARLSEKSIDGIWLDMTIIGDGNCYCPACRLQYRSAKGHEPPRDRTHDGYPEFLEFRYDVVESFYERMRETIRRVAPGLIFTNNYWGYPHSSTGMGSRAVGSARQADFVTGEAYSDWSGIRSTSFLPLFLRGVAGGRPYEALIARAINTWDYTRKPSSYLAYEAFSLFAHGATVTVDDEPLHDGTFDESFYRNDLRAIFGEIGRHSGTVQGAPLRYAAVYHSQSSKDRCRNQSDFVRDMSGAFRMLQDLHLPAEFVFDEAIDPEALRGLSVLLVPNVTRLGDRQWEAFSDFMEHGGLIVASGSLGDALGTRRAEEALGVRDHGPSDYSISYLRLPGMCDHDLLVRGHYERYSASSSDEGCVVDPICETGPREFFHNNLPGPHSPTTVPGLILRPRGKGALALFPQPIYRHYAKEPQKELREILRILVSRFCRLPSVELRIPMKVGYAVYEDGDTLYVHLLNPNVEPSICCGLMDTLDGRFERSYEYMEETVPVHDLSVHIRGRRCASVETLREGSAFAVRPEGDGTEVRVERVELWEVLRIRLGAGTPSMRITTKDLARICGVSLGTIDRALRNRPGIRPETRAMILEKVREYGYTPNIVARNLKMRRTSEVGLIVHDLDNEFFGEFVNAVQEIAWQRDFFLQVAVSRRDEKRERTALEHMAGRNVDGILLFPAGRGPEFDAFLHGLGRPVVTVANKVSDAWPFVGLSDRSIQREATREIIRRGYTRLFFVGPLCVSPGKLNLYEIEERYAGFCQAIGEHTGVRGHLVGGNDYVEELRRVDFSTERTAIVCCSDIFALEVLNDLRSRGIPVPTGVGLMGFDSIDALRYVQPRLSTIEYPVRRMSEVAFSLLMDPRKPDAPAPMIELPPRILWGDSL